MRSVYCNAAKILLPAVFSLSALSGCAGEAKLKPGTSDRMSDESGRMPLSIMHPMYDEQPQQSHIWKYIEDRFQIRYEPVPISSNSYGSKLMLAVSSQNMPDVVIWTSYYSEIVHFVKSGLFHDLTPYIARSANLKNIPQRIWDNASLEGRYYGIPRPRAQVGHAMMVRKDWLDKLQLPLPKTIDDYYRTAVMFGQNDPDGNGKHDTYGFAAGEGLNFLHHLFPAFGAGNTWIEREDGSLEPSKISPEREQGMIWLRQLYEQRGIDRQFSTLKTTQVWDRIAEGKAGIIIAPVSDYDNLSEQLAGNNPNAELVMLGPPEGPTGITAFPETEGYYGLFMIPGSVPAEKVERIVEFLDWQAGEEAYRIRRYGLEGIHHTVAADGKIQVDREALRADNPEQILLMNPYDPYFYVAIHADPEVQGRQRTILEQVQGKGIANPAFGYISETGLSVASIYGKQIQRFETDFVKGEVPLEEFGQFRKEWLDKGGAEVTREVNDWYKGQRGQEVGDRAAGK